MSIVFFSLNENGQLEPFEVEPDVASGLDGLPEDHSKYFDLVDGYEVIPLDKLVSSRARAKGIRNANSFMAAAAAGTMPKRQPISISPLEGDLFKVDDGNSTLINARLSGWTSIPCRRSPTEE
ncbi:hypothetical protein [Agrobacterium salinitolerans]|uniref:Uncharacterized protein n=1 Tax=Agrobacterium salinitolerans TaxID=1183413 RepID=A0A9X3KTK1_9HYPH|nr:hypothetical protein [Agrobacterium salinitolerans]MCZ7940565.1 hypothetical protein [Agrobacterium salinitolerans]